MPSRSRRALLLLLCTLFFASGSSALIYQVLWLRLLGLVFGVTVYAASTVWAAFMGGLAIGSFAAGALADRVRRPLVWFGVAEALIAITALLTPAALDLLQRVYVAMQEDLPQGIGWLTLGRFAIASAVLLVPTALMGATLPLIIKSSLLRAEGLGTRVSVLYGTNTAGAIAGTLAAGLLLIPRYGIRVAFITAATLNLLVAAMAIVAGLRWQAVPARPTAEEPEVPVADAEASGSRRERTTRTVVLLVFALSGFASIAVEVVWFRVLTLFLRPTVYGYAMMLTAVLSGIAIGSFLVAPFMRRPMNWLLVLASLEVAIGAFTLLSFAALPLIPAAIDNLGPLVGAVAGPYLAYQVIVSFMVIFPTMLLFGAAFPVGLRLFVGEDGDSAVAGRRVGLFYSLNLAGAIAGSVAAGFFLLPTLGATGTLTVLALVSAASGWALSLVPGATLAQKTVAIGITTVLFAGAWLIVPDPAGAYLAQRYPNEKIIWQAEAVQAMVSVHEQPGGHLVLNVNGNHQASTRDTMAFVHQRIGHMPMIVHPDPTSALVIGLGGGATAGAVSQHAGVVVDVVELSREVARAANRFFRPINFNVLRKPNVQLHVDDGRNFLLFSKKQYDVITADVILPIHAGSGNLYSKEYFELVARALTPGGMALQWVAGTEAEYKLITRTFLSVFPETTLWSDGSLMIGSRTRLNLRRSDFERKLQVPEQRAVLELLGLTTFEALLGQFIAGPDELRAYVGPGPVLTDDRPLVEYFLGLPRDKAADLSGVRGDVRKFVDAESVDDKR